MDPPTHAIAYKAPSQIVDNLHQDFQGQTVPGKLQDLLTQDEEFDLTCNERVNQVYGLMKQLNNLRTVCAIRGSECIVTNPLDVAGKMKGFWDTVMVHGTSTVSEITGYLKNLPNSTGVQCSQDCCYEPMITRSQSQHSTDSKQGLHLVRMEYVHTSITHW